jgi:cytochrome c
MGWMAGKPISYLGRTMDSVLVFSKTAGYRHGNIPKGIAAIRKLGREHGFVVEATEDAAYFTLHNLTRFGAVVFLNTSGKVLEGAQEEALQAFIRSGGGFAGIHAACDTGYDWPWYGGLVGAYFASHPLVQPAKVRITDPGHPSTAHLPQEWKRWDEWYDFRANPRGQVRVLAVLDESSYFGGKMGADHPIVWCREYEGGRSWYTGLGHTRRGFSDPLYLRHILGGIEYVLGREVSGEAPASSTPADPGRAMGGISA